MNLGTWLRSALPGASFIYHTGLLMADRQRETNEQYLLVDIAGKRAWQAFEAKRVALTQRRIAPGVSEYIATRL